MVIKLQLENGAFEQDIRELLMAFYPGSVFRYEDQVLPDQKCKEEPEPDFIVSGRFLDGNTKYELKAERISVAKTELGGSGKAETGASKTPSKAPSEWEWEQEEFSPIIRKGLKEGMENLPFPIDLENRIDTKNKMKRRLYFLLMLDTRKQLPWGALTGIRPVKIPEGKLAEGWDEERISSYMEENYLTGEKKRRLSFEIAKEERRLLHSLDYQNGYSLYVGIPFCPTTCLYCSFTSYPIEKWKDRLEEYLDILEKELAIVGDTVSNKALQTVYIGGGTPTSLPPKQLERLLWILSNRFPLKTVKEFTVEAGRPDSITREKLRLLNEYGVGRISINPQSMNQKTLDLIGRRHTASQVEQVFWMAREQGFHNINMDLILGLPGEAEEEVKHTLDRIHHLGPESLTVHCLALKRAARLNLERDQYRHYPMASGQQIDSLSGLAENMARSMGMVPYYLYRQKNMAGNLENVGYASKDYGCLYNILMMEEKHTVIGCGAGTTTKVVIPKENRVERLETIKNIQEYLPRYQEVLDKKTKFLQSFPL